MALPAKGHESPLAFLVLLSYGLVSLEYTIARVGLERYSDGDHWIRGRLPWRWARYRPHVRAPRSTLEIRSFAGEARVEPAYGP